MSGSVSFDRAAEYYDETRVTDAATLDTILGLLERTMSSEGPVLEAGVGTGQIALPLAARGTDVTGIDLSAAMMAKLIHKAAGSPPVRLVRGDVTRMPFADGVFAGAYARWVLHLIEDWPAALLDLDRVVGRGGAIAIEPGGMTGVFRDIFFRFLEVLGDVARPIGLDPVDRDVQLDAEMERLGWHLAEIQALEYHETSTLRSFLDRVPDKRYSWTWRVPGEDLAAATTQVREWAEARYELDASQPSVATNWRVYRRAGDRP